jgi:hypothetical protein
MSPTKTRKSTRPGRRASSTTWLDLLATEGPFLAAPVVKETWPDGLPALDRDSVGHLRDASGLLDASPGSRDTFVHHVLADFLGWHDNVANSGTVAPNQSSPPKFQNITPMSVRTSPSSLCLMSPAHGRCFSVS